MLIPRVRYVADPPHNQSLSRNMSVLFQILGCLPSCISSSSLVFGQACHTGCLLMFACKYLCVGICKQTNMHTHPHTRPHTHTHTHTHLREYTHTHTHRHKHMCVYIYIYVYVYDIYIYIIHTPIMQLLYLDCSRRLDHISSSQARNCP